MPLAVNFGFMISDNIITIKMNKAQRGQNVLLRKKKNEIERKMKKIIEFLHFDLCSSISLK